MEGWTGPLSPRAAARESRGLLARGHRGPGERAQPRGLRGSGPAISAVRRCEHTLRGHTRATQEAAARGHPPALTGWPCGEGGQGRAPAAPIRRGPRAGLRGDRPLPGPPLLRGQPQPTRSDQQQLWGNPEVPERGSHACASVGPAGQRLQKVTRWRSLLAYAVRTPTPHVLAL